MPSAADRLSTGEREVFCTRADCAHRGLTYAGLEVGRPLGKGEEWHRCMADIVILDRRPRFGKTCAGFAKRGPGSSDEAAT